ncbi:hypothetical protein GINT2_000132 [Glugoides intestinalis]
MSAIEAIDVFDLGKFKILTFNEKKLKYNSKMIIYNREVVRFENVKIAVGQHVYIQNPYQSIFFSENLKDFVFMGSGEIIGTISSFLITKDGDSYLIYNNGMKVSMFFSMQEDKLHYSHLKSESQKTIYTKSAIYDDFFIVIGDKNAIFVDFNGANDIQYSFAGKISEFYSFKFKGILFFAIAYTKKNADRIALFYSNVLLSSDVFLEKTPPAIMFTSKYFSLWNEDTNCLTEPRQNVAITNRKANDCKVNEIVTVSSSQVEFITNSPSTCLYGEYGLEPVKQKNINAVDVYKKDNSCFRMEDRKPFQLNRIEYAAFKIAYKSSRIAFLKAIFNSETYDIISENASLLVDTQKSLTKLLNNSNVIAFSYLHELAKKSHFYENLQIELLKPQKFKFKADLTPREVLFLSRKYTRIFNYNKKANNSRNLAYKIIEHESKLENVIEKDLSLEDIVSYNKTFLKVAKNYYHDTRIIDMLEIMLENSINLQPDLNDANNFRQDAFLLRCCCNVGAFIANSTLNYYHSIFNAPIKINSVSVEDKLPKELHFLNAACTFSYYKKPSFMNIYQEYGHAFGKGLRSGLSDESLQEHLKLFATSDAHILKFVLLVISTYPSNVSTTKTFDINITLKLGLESSSLETKKAAMCALAIHNLGSHNRNIIDILEEEVEKVGPVNCDKNNEFYNRDYRKIAAICIGTIAAKPLFSNHIDSFCKLIINGLSSIGAGVETSNLSRCDNHRLDEIFYSTLFQLTCTFSIDPKNILVSMYDDSQTESELLIYRAAARLFYISLFYLWHKETCPDDIYNKLLEYTLTVEDTLFSKKHCRILFNFALASLSIVKAGTCDLKILRILRRQVLRAKDIKFMEEYNIFDQNRKDFLLFKGSGMENIGIYKLCIGILLLNFGTAKLTKSSVKYLVISFFLTEACSLEFNFIDILRMLLIRSFEPNGVVIEAYKEILQKINMKAKGKKIMKFFNKKFPSLSEIDKKFIVDVLSDYYENYHFSECSDSIFDMKILATLVSISK